MAAVPATRRSVGTLVAVAAAIVAAVATLGLKWPAQRAVGNDIAGGGQAQHHDESAPPSERNHEDHRRPLDLLRPVAQESHGVDRCIIRHVCTPRTDKIRERDRLELCWHKWLQYEGVPHGLTPKLYRPAPERLGNNPNPHPGPLLDTLPDNMQKRA